MVKTRNLKTGFYVLLTVLCMMLFNGVKTQEVNAAEGDIDIYVEVDGTEKPIQQCSGLSGISYDSANNVLTLNNYEGNSINAVSTDNKLKSLEVKVIGKNYLYATNATDDLLLFENIDVTFTGNGSLYLDLNRPNNSDTYFEQYGRGSVTVDGPTITMDNSRGCLYTEGDFTMKSGTLNIKRYPDIYRKDTYTEYNYYSAIGCDKAFIALGGIINIEYFYPSGYENVSLYNNYFSAIDSYYIPVLKDTKINLVIPDELQGNLYLMPEVDLDIYVIDKSGEWISLDKSEKIDGLSWDADNLCLTLNGYNGNNIRIDCNYTANIEIKVIGNNKITDSKGSALIDINNNIVRFTGSGTINLENKSKVVEYVINGSYASELILDGPTLNYGEGLKGFYYSFISANGISIISGTINAKIYAVDDYGDGFMYGRLLTADVLDFDISGGTIIAEYVPIEGRILDTRALIGINSNNYYSYVSEINTSNCVIVVIGRGTTVDETLVFENTHNKEDRSPIHVGDNTIIIFDDKLENALPIDINLLKGELSETTFVYDGKKKEPKVKVGGLVEGVDFTVTYSNNVDVGTATATVTGKGNYKGTMKLSFKIISDPKKSGLVDGPAKGTTVKDKKYIYKVTKPGSTDGGVIGELEVTGLKKKSLKQIKIAAKVKIDSVTYKVTSVGAKAFKGNKKVTKATIGKNVVKIGANAFAKCSKLKQLTINSKVLKSIGKNACAGDKKLVKVIIKSKKLKKVGKKAFYRKGGKKLIVKVPKAKKAKYKKLLKKAKTNKYKVK